MVRRHYSRTARIGCGLCTLLSRRKKWTARVGRCLYTLLSHFKVWNVRTSLDLHTTSAKTYTHLTRHVCILYVTSSMVCVFNKAYAHGCEMFVYGKGRRPIVCDISEGLHERMWYVNICKETFANGMQHQPISTQISHGL